MRARNLLVAVALAFAALAMTAAPAAAAGAGEDWPAGVSWWAVGEKTRWSTNTVQPVGEPGGSKVFTLQFSEGYRVGTYIAFDVAWAAPNGGESVPPSYIVLEWRLDCYNPDSGHYVLGGPSRGTTYWLASYTFNNGSWGGGTYGTKTFGANLYSSGAFMCPGSEVPVGMAVDISVTSTGEPSANPRRLYWDVYANYTDPGGGMVMCRALFGPDYEPETEAIIGGRLVTAYEFGCFRDQVDDTTLYEDFDYVCRGAPRATLTNFSWLGPWVGHYARCLFYPGGGWDSRGEVESTMRGGWFGEVDEFRGDLGDAAVGGACGVAVSDLPGPLGSISTCSLGGVWPAEFRGLAGMAIVGMAGIASLFMILRVMRISR